MTTAAANGKVFEHRFWDALLFWKQAIIKKVPNGDDGKDFNPNAHVVLLLTQELGRRLDLPPFSLCWKDGLTEGAARWNRDSRSARRLPKYSCPFRRHEESISYSPFFFRWMYSETGIPAGVHVRQENAPAESGFRLILGNIDEPVTEGWRWLCSSIVALKAISVELHFVMGELERRTVLSESLGLLKRVFKSSPDDIFEFLTERSENFSTAAFMRMPLADLEKPAIEIVDRCVGGSLQREIILGKLRRAGENDSLGIICERLAELVGRGGRNSETLEIVLESLQGFRGAIVSLPQETNLGKFLGHWIRLEQIACGAVKSPAAPPVDDQDWVFSRDRTIPAIRRHLAGTGWGAAGAEEEHEPSRIRTWLHLWLCLRMLEAEEKEGDQGFSFKLLGPERRRYRADLAYVLRESIRHAVLGREGQFIYQPATYAAALQSIVEFHASHVVGLPRHTQVRETLDLLGDEHRRSSRYLPIDLLRHVLDVYILGHFLISIEVIRNTRNENTTEDQAEQKNPTLGLLLAGAGRSLQGKGAVSDFEKVFSLSAIYHDVGHVFLGSQGGLPEGVLGNPDSVLDTLENDLGRTFRGLGETCVKALPPNLLEGAGAFDLKEWIGRQKRDGWVSHSLLGAWYLINRCGEVESSCKGVVEGAGRAVLLHAAHPVPIDSARDPAAALLILCNELFELESTPGRKESAPSAVGRSLHVMAAPRAPSEARYRAMRLQGLIIKNDESTFTASIEPHRQGSNPGLVPVFELELLHPEFLDRPTFAIILEKAQGLGRIRAGNGPQGEWWRPCIRLHERQAHVGAVQRLGFPGNCELLEHLMDRTELPCRPGVCGWLESEMPFRSESSEELVNGPASGFVELRPLDRPLYHGDLRRLLPGLIEEFNRLTPGVGSHEISSPIEKTGDG